MSQERLSLAPESTAGDGHASWPTIIFAGLPHFLFATTMAMSGIITGPAPSWLTVFRYGLPVMMGVAFLLAWRRGWPLWGGSWAGYWLLFPYFLAGSFLTWRPGLDYLLLVPPAAVGLFLFLRRPLYGLLAIVAPLLIMTRLFAFEVVVGGDWIWSGIWLLLALTTGAIVWLGSVRAGVLFTVAFQLMAGLIISIARSYLPYRGLGATHMGPRPTPELAKLVNDFLPLTLASITVPLALLLLYPLGEVASRGGQRGRHSHKLLLLGMAITFGGVFALRARPSPIDGLSSALVAAVLGAGLLLALGAAVTLIKAVRSGPDLFWHDLLLPLLATFAPLVVLALARPFPTAGQYSASFQVQVFLSYAGVLTWTVLAILTLVGRRGGRVQPKFSVEVVPG